MKKIIVITCTYERPLRSKFIKRCIECFQKVPELFWIVVEDAASPAIKIKELLEASGIKFEYLSIGPTADKGNSQKNLAIEYIRKKKLKGIVYIADDDNVYAKKLFQELRKVKRIAIFPVGNKGPNRIERPIVRDRKIVGWDAAWLERKFPVDMGGFAFNSEAIQGLDDQVWFWNVYGGETEFLEKFVKSKNELELLCDMCKKCYVWHNQPLDLDYHLTNFEIKYIDSLLRALSGRVPILNKCLKLVRRGLRKSNRILSNFKKRIKNYDK
ncbi:MAG: glycosyltransferase family 43 protein [Candidatus Omnitrophica bacterium]|nr:glycosyltransferase family 43 protein [Candidatus Omnitrophota bacterium]